MPDRQSGDWRDLSRPRVLAFRRSIVKKETLAYRKLCLHGLGIELSGPETLLGRYVQPMLRPFVVPTLAGGLQRVVGSILPYEEAEVLRHLSHAAQRIEQDDPSMELYQDGERFWLVDERWGLAELNLLKGQWRSWILPQPTADEVRCAEGAVLWPLAQLLKSRGVFLLPAVSVVKDGWGVLILGAFSLEPELECLLSSGYRLIGQRWTAVRESDGFMELLAMPGVMEKMGPPQLRRTLGGESKQWIDLTWAHPESIQRRAICDVVLLASPGRRSAAHANDLSMPEALLMLRQNWPIVDVHPTRRPAHLPGRMAQLCRCVQVQLSRRPEDLVVLMDSLRHKAPAPGPAVAVFVNPAAGLVGTRRAVSPPSAA
jgi:hypothetical protein